MRYQHSEAESHVEEEKMCLTNLKRDIGTLYIILCHVPQHNQSTVEANQNLLTTENKQ